MDIQRIVQCVKPIHTPSAVCRSIHELALPTQILFLSPAIRTTGTYMSVDPAQKFIPKKEGMLSLPVIAENSFTCWLNERRLCVKNAVVLGHVKASDDRSRGRTNSSWTLALWVIITRCWEKPVPFQALDFQIAQGVAFLKSKYIIVRPMQLGKCTLPFYTVNVNTPYAGL